MRQHVRLWLYEMMVYREYNIVIDVKNYSHHLRTR